MAVFDFHKVPDLTTSSLADRQLTEVSVGEKKIGLVKINGTISAFAAKCPHAGAPLCTGWLDAQGRIVCPDHKYRFDPTNGHNTTGEGYKLFTYPVEIREEEIFVGLIMPHD